CPYESVHPGLDIANEERRNLFVEKLIQYLDFYENIHFKFFVINGNTKNGDNNLTRKIISSAKPKSFEIIDYSPTTQMIWNSIAACDFVVSTRLHAAIFSCFANVPFMLNEYHRKCGDFLDNVGYHESYRLFDSSIDVAEKGNQILSILNSPSEYRFPESLSEMESKAEFNFTKIVL